MSKIKTYTLLNSNFLFGSLLMVFIILYFPLMLYGTVKVLSGFWNNNETAGYFGILLLIINSYLFYYFSLVIYQYAKYLWYEKNTRIEVDYENEIIAIVKDSYTYVFNSENLKSIEFHLSTQHYKNLLRYFGYTKLISQDGREFIITNFVLDYTLIENMFNSVKKIKKLNEIIYLS